MPNGVQDQEAEEEGSGGESGEEHSEAEEDEESDVDMPEVGADGQPQPDRASSNEPRAEVPPATGGGQAGTDQPPVPPTDATDCVLQSFAAPPAAGNPSV